MSHAVTRVLLASLGLVAASCSSSGDGGSADAGDSGTPSDGAADVLSDAAPDSAGARDAGSEAGADAAPPPDPCAAHGGTTYYLAPSGDDANPGTKAAPFRTLTHGASVLAAGDTLCIRAGTYGESIQFGTSGTQASPIVFSGYPGERPVIDLMGSAPNAFAIWNDSMEIGWIELLGLEIRGATFAIHFSNVHHLTIEDDWVHDNGGQGILGSGHDILIDRNRVYANGITATPTNQNHGMYLTGRRYLIADNLVYGNEAFGLQIAAYGCGTNCLGPDDSGAVDFTVANNVFAYEKNRSGIVVWLPGTGYGSEAGTDLRNVTIVNDVFLDDDELNPGSTVGVEVDDEYGSDPSGANWPSVVVANDLVFATNGGAAVTSAPAITVQSIIQGKDPSFVSPMSYDFHLQPGSPAIGAGQNLTSLGSPVLDVDFDGHPRPPSGAWDLGAYVHP